MLTPLTPQGSDTPQSRDDGLLNDLLDGRLAAAEAQALSQRMEREHALREAYDELLRTRELFRAAPDPQPPADFTARVRACIDAEAAAVPPAQVASANGRAVPGSGPGVPVLAMPPAWRRLMLVAYAAAALLMVAIGVMSLRRGQQDAAPAGGSLTHETAGLTSSKDKAAPQDDLDAWKASEALGVEGGLRGAAPKEASDLEAKDAHSKDAHSKDAHSKDAHGVPGLKQLHRESNEARARDSDGEAPAAASDPVAPARVPAEEAAEAAEAARAARAAGAAGAVAGLGGGGGGSGGAGRSLGTAGARSAPHLGPGGGVRPGLRQPSDLPQPAPSVTAAAPPGAVPPLPEPNPEIGPALAPVDGPLAARSGEAQPVLDVLLLEAPDAAAGRALVAQVLAGPGAPAGGGADGRVGGFTAVKLRRADLRADAVLLANLRALAPASTPAMLPRGDAAPSTAAPQTPAAPAAAAPLAAPAASSPAAPPSAARAAATGPAVLADFWEELSPDQVARLEALLGPLPAKAQVPGDPAPAALPPPGARRVRFVITAPR